MGLRPVCYIVHLLSNMVINMLVDVKRLILIIHVTSNTCVVKYYNWYVSCRKHIYNRLPTGYYSN